MGWIMTAEKYLECNECKSNVYICKNGRLESRPQEMNDIAAFIEEHEFNCEGNMYVVDESGVNEDYESYTGKGRKP